MLKMKKICVLQILTLTCSITIIAQRPLKGCPKLISYSSQIADALCDSSIKKVELAAFSERVIIKYKNGEKRFIPKDSVWGIRRKNDYPSRLFNGYSYQLFQLSPVLKYSRQVGKHALYYFSKGLDSPIYPYEKKQLKDHLDSATYRVITQENNATRKEIAFDFFTTVTKLVDQRLWGGGLSFKYYPSKKFATGLYLGFSGKSIKDTFGFSVLKPVINNMEIGWLNQYDIVLNQKFRTALVIINGFSYAELRDRAIKERVRTRHGYQYVSKKIATNYYYLLQPALDVSVKLLGKRHNPDLYVTMRTGYRSVFGSNRFGSKEQFGGFLFAAGISLIGFDKELL